MFFGFLLGGNGAGVYIIHRMRSIDNLPDNQHNFLADIRVSSSSLLFIDCAKDNESLHFIQEGPVQKAPYFHSPEPVYLTEDRKTKQHSSYRLRFLHTSKLVT